MHDAIADLDIYEAEAVLGMVTGAVSAAYQAFQEKVQIKELKLQEVDAKAKRILDLSQDLDVQRVLIYSDALHNAINTHKYIKTKEWKVKDLEIELL